MSNTLKLGNGKWATGKDTLLSFSDTNNNYKPLAFSFSRDTSGTVINKDGLIETVGSGEPRIDFKDNTKGALLLEPSRTNLFTYSEDFSNASWTKYTSTYSNNTINASSGTGFKGLSQNEATQGVQSVYFDVEYTDHQWFQIGLGTNGTDYGFVNFDIKNKIVGTQSGGVVGSIVDYGSFVRIIANINTTSKTSIFLIFVDNSNSSRAASTSSVGSFKLYRSQLEQGSYATSYIPTNGQANGVTRVYDTMPSYLDVTPLNIGNSYTLFLDADLNVNDNNKVFGAINNSVGGLSFTMRNNVGGIRLYNHIDAGYPVSGIISSTNKFVIRVDGNSYKIFVQGASLSGTLTTQRNLGALLFNGQNTELKINNFKIDNTALSDAECESLVN